MRFILLSLSLFALNAGAQGRYQIPADNQVLEQISNRSENPVLPAKFSLLVWNTHKGSPAWAQDLAKLSTKADVVLLQEAMKDGIMDSFLRSLPLFNFYMAHSFANTRERWSTGVATGAKAVPIHLQFSRSPDREPVIRTPKMILLSYYNISTGEELMTINIHAINFVSWKLFARQILALETAITQFPGKIVFSGDFNTWNRKRKNFLFSTLQKWGLTRYYFPNDARFLKLDHLFVKGCLVIDGQVLEHITSSDHAPLYAKLDCR